MGNQANVQRSEHMWSNGNMVIIRTQGRIYRVLAETLTQKSPVFKDLVEDLPAAPVNYLEGDLVLDVQDDAEELEMFLRAIYDTEFTFPTIESPFDLAAMLRLSHKYRVFFLRRRALQQLEQVYGIILFDLSKRYILGTAHWPEPLRLRVQVLTRNFNPRAHLVAIKSLVEVGALWLLPAAYYELCAYDIRAIQSAGPTWDVLEVSEKSAFIAGHSEVYRSYSKFITFLFKQGDSLG
ncbi:hypothetical protein FB45DRAFT_71723 [Roridomyces roridus]|uniref:BTB domain-containing protein n=1 Tax=Roridomyces roridus TaxID=1738132 RepID=A0AAD7BNI1_9AGAR|nr:hypothetical protein FB45DRAFT_71723 [Roridomyces roridus]